MLTKQVVHDKIEILHLAGNYPVIQIRTATIIAEDGVEISRTFHRRVLDPSCTLDGSIANEDQELIDIANTVFTNEALVAYQAHQAQGA